MISAFGVEHGDEIFKRSPDPKRGDKIFGSPTKTAAVAGIAGASLISRGKANKLGGKIGEGVQNHARWSAGRAYQMKNPTGKAIRQKYAVKLNDAGKGMRRSDDTREWTGRAAVGGAAAALAGGTVYGRKRLTPVDKEK